MNPNCREVWTRLYEAALRAGMTPAKAAKLADKMTSKR